jgi:serine protease AprX
MGRNTGGNPGDVRSSALWGSGNRGGEHRSNALWGKGGRGAVVTLVAVLMLSLGAGSVTGRDAPAVAATLPATYVEPGLLEKAQASPKEMFRVIVQSVAGADGAENAFENVEAQDDQQLQQDEKQADRDEDAANKAESKAKTKAAKAKLRAERESAKAQAKALKMLRRSIGGELDDRFDLIGGVSVEMSGRRLAKLARVPGLSITEDVEVQLLDGGWLYGQLKYNSKQLWAHESGVSELWYATPRAMPAIAIVDSGIDETLPDFAGRSVVKVNFVGSGKPNGARDGRGHGSFVAGIAAGSASGYAGVAPNAPLVSLDVMDDSGSGRTSDVILATEWLIKNHKQYDIKVANYSLHGGGKARFHEDPLNEAVTKLWQSGVTVVAAAGNYGRDGAPSGVYFAPGNNPFVITVGAVDIGGTAKTRDDDRAPWSAYGRTQDGFWKPEICAPGRMMIGPVPTSSTLAVEKASKMKSPGYVELSGTSFAAPVISGVAAHIIARNPSMTPDQVKGAVMRRARDVPRAENRSCGVGQVNAVRAVLNATQSSNPNAALNRFLKFDSATGLNVFDAVSWTDMVRSNVSWDAVSWSDVSWSDVSWDAVSWADVSWADVSWADVSWSDVSWEDAADEPGTLDGSGIPLTPEEEAEAEADPDLQPLPGADLPPADPAEAPAAEEPADEEPAADEAEDDGEGEESPLPPLPLPLP